MKIILTKEESEKIFYDSLCNTLSMGIMHDHGLTLEYDKESYVKAKESLEDPCAEDIWMQILRQGDKLTLYDEEGDGDMTRSITLKDVHEKVANTPIEHLVDIHRETDDAYTGDAVLQTVFFDEIIFG